MTTAIVIDDDYDTIKAFEEYLKMKNINVLGLGTNGKEAMDLYAELKPDVVLLDIMMPQYDGFYALEKIREFDSNAKVIAVTADMTADTEKKLMDLKVSAITYKPYDIDNIVDTIEEISSKGEKISSL